MRLFYMNKKYALFEVNDYWSYRLNMISFFLLKMCISIIVTKKVYKNKKKNGKI